MIIPVIGPSKAGKTATTKALVRSGIPSISGPIERVDLDEELGQSCRGDGDVAAARVKALVAKDRPSRLVFVDVGAGQLVESVFACYVSSFPGYPSSVVVIWCDEPTFRDRHGENAHNEVGRYYGHRSQLTSFWANARSARRLVDTSGRYDPPNWIEQLGLIIREMANHNSAGR